VSLFRLSEVTFLLVSLLRVPGHFPVMGAPCWSLSRVLSLFWAPVTSYF